MKGEGVEMNLQLGFSLYKTAIDKGEPRAMFSYVTFLRDSCKVTKDKPEAARLFKIAMEKGHEKSAIMYAIMLR